MVDACSHFYTIYLQTRQLFNFSLCFSCSFPFFFFLLFFFCSASGLGGCLTSVISTTVVSGFCLCLLFLSNFVPSHTPRRQPQQATKSIFSQLTFASVANPVLSLPPPLFALKIGKTFSISLFLSPKAQSRFQTAPTSVSIFINLLKISSNRSSEFTFASKAFNCFSNSDSLSGADSALSISVF